VLIASRWKYLGLRIQGYCYQMFLGFQSHTHWQHWWGVAELGKQHYLMFLLVAKPLDVLLEISSSMATLKYKKHLHGYLGKQVMYFLPFHIQFMLKLWNYFFLPKKIWGSPPLSFIFKNWISRVLMCRV